MKFLGYEVDEDTMEIDAPCECDLCRAVTRGEATLEYPSASHPYCAYSPPALLKAEDEGKVYAQFRGGAWVWILNSHKEQKKFRAEPEEYNPLPPLLETSLVEEEPDALALMK